jgi:predicted nucleotidyltransferase component of viral defense system
MATKLRALFQRRKGRDLFDLWYVLEKNLIDVEKVIFMFQKYCQNGNIQITQEMFQKNLADKMHQPDFKSDIIPLLIPEINWDSDMAFKKVTDELIQKL